MIGDDSFLSGSMPLEQENAKKTKKGGVNSILSGSVTIYRRVFCFLSFPLLSALFFLDASSLFLHFPPFSSRRRSLKKKIQSPRLLVQFNLILFQSQFQFYSNSIALIIPPFLFILGLFLAHTWR